MTRNTFVQKQTISMNINSCGLLTSTLKDCQKILQTLHITQTLCINSKCSLRLNVPRTGTTGSPVVWGVASSRPELVL